MKTEAIGLQLCVAGFSVSAVNGDVLNIRQNG